MTDADLLKLDTVRTARDASEPEPQLTPLTDGQESLYILSRLGHGLPLYNIPFAFRLRGPLNLRAFTNALRLLVERHHALRSNIIETDKGLRQWTWNSSDLALEFHDCARLEASERDREFQEMLVERASAPFDLARETPFRADLFKLSNDEHVALFTLHHTFGDLTSMRILFRDFEETYNAILGGQAPALPEIAMQSDQYAARESERQPRAETLKYWSEQTAALQNDLELPADFPRPHMSSFQGALHRFEIPKPLAGAVKALARANRCSAYMAFLALLQLLIYRYTNQRRFAISTPFSRRQEPELENTIAYLINLLPIPCAINPRASFRDLLTETRRMCLEVFAHEDISLRRILQEAKIAGDSPKNALSRVVFQYFAEGPATLNLKHLEVEPELFHTGTSKFDLCITMMELEGPIAVEIEYDIDLFHADTMARLSQHLLNLSEAVVRNLDVEVGQLTFLTAWEKCFLAEINESKTSYPRDATVVQLFEQQASQNPSRMALSFENTQVTYFELNRRAEQVAQLLAKRGVRPGDFVGVCLDRSPALVAALIGILKAGAAFVPFDAKYPEARLKYLFEDAGVHLLITSAAQKHIAPASVEVALIEECAGEVLENGVAKTKPLVSPDSLAYMMYTSGSTGNPKGVTVPHRAIVRLVKNNDFADFSEAETFLLFAPISFDASTLEIWGPLLNGGALAIYPPTFESLEQFEEVLTREKVTTLWLSSGLFNTIVDRKIESLKNVRQLLVGGDVVSPLHVRRVYESNPNVTIINGYGPTENTTFTCCFTIPRDWPEDRAIPIGRAIRNTQVYVLDENLQPMPVGASGELFCGGDGLSHGYWNKPDLTAQSFVAHPFFAGARLYRTGDRVRLLKDGNLEFLGRFDTQIKIRGFRIELGEIESAFRMHPDVRDAAAVVESDAADGKRLLAFVISESGKTISPADLHEHIRKTLPEQSCPSRIHIVEEFPLGPNGKVDKKALLALPVNFAPPPAETISLNATESAISRVWKDLLDLPAIAPDENFFHLGGDSLRAIQAVLQINRALNSNLTVSHIFEAPSIRSLARKIDAPREGAAIRKSRIEPIQRSRDVEEMSDSEVDALLNQLLVKEG